MNKFFYDMITNLKREGLLLPAVLFTSAVIVLFYELVSFILVNI
ncbi:hypothetical protein [Fulvivirga sedimenti]|nr:hypothetical protein [Fulvivirga sedimenti]